MKQLLIFTMFLLATIFNHSSAVADQASDLKMYLASSVKFDEAIRSSKYGNVGSGFALQQKQLIDDLISGNVLAKDCVELLAATPTLRPGVYNVYPTKIITQPTVVTCTPVDIPTLVLNLMADY